MLAADLVAAGANVALTSRDALDAERAAADLRSGAGPATTPATVRTAGFAADTSSAEGARRAVAVAARALDGLDAVVYVASGGFRPKPPQEIEEAEWERSFDVVAKGFFFTACAARDLFVDRTSAAPGGDATRAGGAPGGDVAASDAPSPALPPICGVIVAITDLLGLQPWASFAAHGAAKAAEIHLVKTLGRAWAPQGVRVCGIAPGPVDLPDDEHREATLRTAAKSASERLVAPAQVGASVRFCLENDAVIGVNLIVDAGSLVAF
jgi:NAD(P)-dependent dehydrogenase (short-subunit alcohol dehydrogenase family)